MQLQGIVNPPSTISAQDTSQPIALMGKQAELIAAELHGKFYTQTYRALAYWGSAAATGIITTIFSNTTYVGLLIWNPQGSGKNIVPIRAMQGMVLAATTVALWGDSFLANAGSGIATGAPLSAFTSITATRGPANNPGVTGQGTSVALVGGGATLTTALAWGRANGQFVGTGATSIVGMPNMYDYDGTLVIPPGTVWVPYAASAAQGGTWVPSAQWYEAPL